MAKDTSGHSSAAGSVHAPSPCKIEDENEVLEIQRLGDTPLDVPSNPTLADDTNGIAATNAPDLEMAVSQPMSASNSTSSNPSVKDTAISTGSATPYGTRSRNRTGASRPNYAEDKELDAEFEIPATKENSSRKGRPIDTSASDTARSTNPNRKAPVPGDDQITNAPNHQKDPIPGTSTFSANPTVTTAPATNSKKRKAAAHQMQQASSPSTFPVQTVTRRASMVAQVASGFRETNMLTFENCAGRLKGKKLIADDGTILEVNGMYISELP